MYGDDGNARLGVSGMRSSWCGRSPHTTPDRMAIAGPGCPTLGEHRLALAGVAVRVRVCDTDPMAQPPTIHRIQIALTDVDRGVYEQLDLRLARHPSETVRYMVTRTLAYALRYTEGIAFSKGGLSSPDEAPVAVRDPTGLLLAWIDVGAPSAERLHKASKLAREVHVYTAVDEAILRKELLSRPIHRLADLCVWQLEPRFVDAIEAAIGRDTSFALTHTEGQLYATIGAETVEGRVLRLMLP